MRTTRETSVDAYDYVKPYLSTTYSMIMGVMRSRPDKDGWTMREIRQEIIDGGLMPPDKCLSSSMSARLNEMVKRGNIVNDGKKVCDISGRRCIVRKLKSRAQTEKRDTMTLTEWFK